MSINFHLRDIDKQNWRAPLDSLNNSQNAISQYGIKHDNDVEMARLGIYLRTSKTNVIKKFTDDLWKYQRPTPPEYQLRAHVVGCLFLQYWSICRAE